MNPREHHREAKRLAQKAESKRREPHQQFDIEPWLKAQTHATIALCGVLEEIRDLLAPPEVELAQTFGGQLPGEAG